AYPDDYTVHGHCAGHTGPLIIGTRRCSWWTRRTLPIPTTTSTQPSTSSSPCHYPPQPPDKPGWSPASRTAAEQYSSNFTTHSVTASPCCAPCCPAPTVRTGPGQPHR